MPVSHAELTEIAHKEIRELNAGLELRVKERTIELERKSEEIQQLNGRLMQLQDEERRRLARELHDSTGQMLAALNINLTLMKDLTAGAEAKMTKIVQESGALTEELTRQIRTMSYLLHPPLLDEAGLESALALVYRRVFAAQQHCGGYSGLSEPGTSSQRSLKSHFSA